MLGHSVNFVVILSSAVTDVALNNHNNWQSSFSESGKNKRIGKRKTMFVRTAVSWCRLLMIFDRCVSASQLQCQWLAWTCNEANARTLSFEENMFLMCSFVENRTNSGRITKRMVWLWRRITEHAWHFICSWFFFWPSIPTKSFAKSNEWKMKCYQTTNAYGWQMISCFVPPFAQHTEL